MRLNELPVVRYTHREQRRHGATMEILVGTVIALVGVAGILLGVFIG